MSCSVFEPQMSLLSIDNSLSISSYFSADHQILQSEPQKPVAGVFDRVGLTIGDVRLLRG